MKMATKADNERKTAKRDAIIARLEAIRGNEDILLGLLDEGKLDLMILALGIGVVILKSEDDPE
jgi:hypothetical protein